MAVEFNGRLYLFEIKSTMTVTPKFAEPLRRVLRTLDRQSGKACLITRQNEIFQLGPKIFHQGWKGILAA